MSFVMNDAGAQQLSFLDPYNTLTEREKRFLKKSWAKYFAEHIFPKIDEIPYAVLYSNKDSRPNTPVNTQTGSLVLKEFTGLSDDDILTSLMFDIRFQYALYTTSFIEQPLNDRTLGRFREKAGKQNHGYVANVTEISSENGSMVTDYQYEKNTYSDSQFMKDSIEKKGKQPELVTAVTYGAVLRGGQ